MKTAFALLSVLFLTISAQSQFKVRLNISGSDQEVKEKISKNLSEELYELKDIEIVSEGRIEIKVDSIKRRVSADTYDVYLSVITVENSFCVIEKDERGRVISSSECKELLTSNSYVGRENEVAAIIKEFTSMLNLYVFRPRRPVTRN